MACIQAAIDRNESGRQAYPRKLNDPIRWLCTWYSLVFVYRSVSLFHDSDYEIFNLLAMQVIL